MTNLGAIALTFSGRDEAKTVQLIRPSPLSYTSRHEDIFSIPCHGKRSGIISLSGTPVAGVLVRLYLRDSGVLVSQQHSKADGSYEFVGLDPTALNQYMVMMVDPKTEAPFNYTLVQDHLTAEPA